MSDDYPLCALLCGALDDPVEVGPVVAARIETRLADWLADCARKWPELRLEATQYVPYLAQRVTLEEGLEAGLDRLCATDLYLACACAQRIGSASACFERHVFPDVAIALRSIGMDADRIDELEQRLRLDWLVSDAAQTPKIVQYRGRGELRKWFRVVAVRAARRMLRQERKGSGGSDEDLMRIAAPGDDQEIAHLKELYRGEFKQAFAAALASLSSRDRNVLRYRYLEDLSIDEIGAIYHVHRATTARWLARAREQLLAATRRQMTAQLRVDRGQLDSILRLIESHLEVSLQRHLLPDEEP